MAQPISQEDNLILQSYCTVMLMNALAAGNNLLESDYYKTLNIEPPIRQMIDEIKVGNRGALLMFLYAMLVIPRELLSAKYQAEYNEIDLRLVSLTQSTNTTYDESPVQYVRHIRNAVAHARVTFSPPPDDSVTFEDKDRGGHTFATTMPLRHVGLLLDDLQQVHRKWVNDCRSKWPTR
jgi:hypothetical protein